MIGWTNDSNCSKENNIILALLVLFYTGLVCFGMMQICRTDSLVLFDRDIWSVFLQFKRVWILKYS